jgi:hypothetical protein
VLENAREPRGKLATADGSRRHGDVCRETVRPPMMEWLERDLEKTRSEQRAPEAAA